jgi:hypothetical protein
MSRFGLAALVLTQRNHGRTSIQFILKGFDVRMLLKDRMDDLPLDANPLTMNDTHLAKTKRDRLVQIFFHGNPDFTWLKSMQVDGVPDWDFVHVSRI